MPPSSKSILATCVEEAPLPTAPHSGPGTPVTKPFRMTLTPDLLVLGREHVSLSGVLHVFGPVRCAYYR